MVDCIITNANLNWKVSNPNDTYCIWCKTINDFINELFFVILNMVNENENIKIDIISLDVNIWTEICLTATKRWLTNVNNIEEKRNSSSMMDNDYFSNLLSNLHNNKKASQRELLRKNYGYIFVELTKLKWFKLFFNNVIITL